MTWKLYDYISIKGINEFKKWTEKLEEEQVAKLNSKLDDLMEYGTNLPPQLLSESGMPHIKKMRFKGRVAMRPLLCEGPTTDDKGKYNKEFTLLCGAIEKNWKLEPVDALYKAKERREEIIKAPKLRRCIHEPVEAKINKRFSK